MGFDKQVMSDFIKRYDCWIESLDSSTKTNYKHYEKQLDEFLDLYSLESVMKLEKDDYIVGKKEKTFCWWVETNLAKHGDIRPKFLTSYQKFGLDYDKSIGQYRFGGKKVKKTKFGKNSDEIFNNVRNALIELIKASFDHDYEAIASNPLNELFKSKITYLYNRNDYLPIYSDGDLNILLSYFGIPYSIGENRIYKRVKLFEYYKALNRDDISTISFMRFVYNEAGLRPFLRSEDNIKLKEGIRPKKYRLIDVDNSIAAESEKSKREGLIKGETEESIQSKKNSGKKGEEIVKEYLLSHKEELDIVGDIVCQCEKNDYAHYDFSYQTSNGKIVYIEVKATRRNNESIVSFEMSDSEFDFMNSHFDNYFIFYVNNVFDGDVILRIPAKKVLTKPSKYKANFIIE